MSDKLNSEKHMSVSINDSTNHDYIIKLGKALSIPDRLRILQALSSEPMNMYEISKSLGIPFGSVARHIDALVDANLIFMNYMPGPKGHTKQCCKAVLGIDITLEDAPLKKREVVEKVEMPIGMYSEFNVTTPCGMNGKEKTIGLFDDPSVFYSPDRLYAENLWFEKGYVSYNFPIKKKTTPYASVSFSFEICSECPYHNNVWQSDITISLNDIEIITFTSPGDFGGRRGTYTPEYWPMQSTQYGLLKTITINKSDIFFDRKPLKSNLSIADFINDSTTHIKLQIAVKEDAKHCGGVNLFGKNFGDFPQAIVMRLYPETELHLKNRHKKEFGKTPNSISNNSI